MSSIVAHSNIFQEQAVPLNFTNVTLEHVVKNVGFKSLIAHDIHNRKEIIVIVYLNHFKESKIWSKQVLFSDRIHFVHKWHTFIFFIATILIVSQNNSTSGYTLYLSFQSKNTHLQNVSPNLNESRILHIFLANFYFSLLDSCTKTFKLLSPVQVKVPRHYI